MLTSFLVGLFNLYEDLYFTYLEINPLGKLQKQPTPPQLSARFLIQVGMFSFWHSCVLKFHSEKSKMVSQSNILQRKKINSQLY